MTDDIYVYLIDIPGKIHEMVMPCQGGYTIYIDKNLDRLAQLKAYQHALSHIENGDFEKTNATMIELFARRNV